MLRYLFCAFFIFICSCIEYKIVDKYFFPALPSEYIKNFLDLLLLVQMFKVFTLLSVVVVMVELYLPKYYEKFFSGRLLSLAALVFFVAYLFQSLIYFSHSWTTALSDIFAYLSITFFIIFSFVERKIKIIYSLLIILVYSLFLHYSLHVLTRLKEIGISDPDFTTFISFNQHIEPYEYANYKEIKVKYSQHNLESIKNYMELIPVKDLSLLREMKTELNQADINDMFITGEFIYKENLLPEQLHQGELHQVLLARDNYLTLIEF